MGTFQDHIDRAARSIEEFIDHDEVFQHEIRCYVEGMIMRMGELLQVQISETARDELKTMYCPVFMIEVLNKLSRGV